MVARTVTYITIPQKLLLLLALVLSTTVRSFTVWPLTTNHLGLSAGIACTSLQPALVLQLGLLGALGVVQLAMPMITAK